MLMVFYLKRSTCISILAILLQNVAFAQKGGSTVEPPDDSIGLSHVAYEAYETAFPAMGTTVEMMAYASSPEIAERAFLQAELLTSELSGILSDYDPESETRKLTPAAFHQPTAVSETLWHVLQAADRWHQKSAGVLDCSLGALTALWRKHRRVDRIPSQEIVQQACGNSGWHQVQLDQRDHSVRLLGPKVRLDFGAIGKGYIVDQLYDLLQQHGLKHCLVNISGNMRAGEAPPGRAYWRISVSPLRPQGQAIRRIGLVRAAIATSGDLWQFSIIDGQKRSHILDPSTGYGVPGPLAVTAIAPTALDADALATIGCVMDWQQFAQRIQAYEGSAALRAMERDGVVETLQTGNFPSELED